MALRSKFITSYRQRHGLTHFLAIPLVTPTSITQVSDSLKCLWDDLAAIGVPNDAIRPLGLLHLNLEIPLSLKTPERRAKASEILRKFSFEETVPTIHDSSISGDYFRHSSRALEKSNDDTNKSTASPSVSIASLFCQPGKEAEAVNLSAIVYDATHRVRDWKVRIANAYQAAGLSPKQHYSKRSQKQAVMNRLWGSYDATICLMRVPSSKETVPCPRDPGKMMSPRRDSFDARGLMERYKNHVWIENAPLERVSICKMRFHKLEVEELPEVFSVPLS
ncbi:hypothetical protein JMJ35_003334 [Cladonia borealis]|uniref:Uncharacterized protein n=1 Tax=Cladonia borealis TaxID=184061 RepID=A0AA39R4F5_9LECA|nr:hypothetical protein JMJ35_003334 [Cladonia borealis]